MKKNCDFDAHQAHVRVNIETKNMQYFKITVFLNLFSHMKNREWTLVYGNCEKVEVDTVILNM